jgi:hypothetical protein
VQRDEIRKHGEYVARVGLRGDRLVVVRIDDEAATGGWWATNVRTARSVRLRTPRQLVREATMGEVDRARAGHAFQAVAS